MAEIGNLLGEPEFDYAFTHIQHVTWDVDEMYQIPGLPPVRPNLEPSQPQWPLVLGPWAEKFAPNNHLWRQFRKRTDATESAALVASPSMS